MYPEHMGADTINYIGGYRSFLFLYLEVSGFISIFAQDNQLKTKKT
jgi:hypothetical protein